MYNITYKELKELISSLPNQELNQKVTIKVNEHYFEVPYSSLITSWAPLKNETQVLIDLDWAREIEVPSSQQLELDLHE